MIECLIAGGSDEESIPIHASTKQNQSQLLDHLGADAVRWAGAMDFRSKRGTVLVIPGPQGLPRCVLFGLGAHANERGQDLIAGKLATGLPPGVYRFEGDHWHPARDALAFALGAYRYQVYKADERQQARLVVPEQVDFDELIRIADGVNVARDLVNMPANDLGPAELAEKVRAISDAHGAVLEVLVGEQLLENNFPLIHAVGAASDRAPRLIDMAWGNPGDPKVTLVGKGVCFDSGGLNLKPGGSMVLMKKDMGGAANVIGLAKMIMSANLPIRLRVVIPAVENSISGSAFRPGDIFPSRKGPTVEIGNTDAEGRLVLADALAFADEEKPDLMIDMATLTGAARVALGPDLPPFYTDDDAFAQSVATHAIDVADPVWRLPLWDDYDAMLKSDIADINHISSGGFAGSITAALFLRRFVENAAVWAHFDIYAWSPKAKPWGPRGGEAQAIRTLYALIKDRF